MQENEQVWENFFAWRPIQTRTGSWTWLATVERADIELPTKSGATYTKIVYRNPSA